MEVGNGRVVGHAERPGLQRTAAIEALEALPELQVDLLPQVVTLVRIGLVADLPPITYSQRTGGVITVE